MDVTDSGPRTAPRRDLSLSEMLDTLRWIIDKEGAIPEKGSDREQRFLDLWGSRLDLSREARPTPVEPEAPFMPPQHCDCGRELPCFDHRRLAVEPDGLPLDVPRLARAIHNDRQGDDDLCFTGGKMARPPSPWHSCDEDAKRIAREYVALGAPSEDET